MGHHVILDTLKSRLKNYTNKSIEKGFNVKNMSVKSTQIIDHNHVYYGNQICDPSLYPIITKES